MSSCKAQNISVIVHKIQNKRIISDNIDLYNAIVYNLRDETDKNTEFDYLVLS